MNNTDENNLSGSIPSEIGKLDRLNIFNLREYYTLEYFFEINAGHYIGCLPIDAFAVHCLLSWQ